MEKKKTRLVLVIAVVTCCVFLHTTCGGNHEGDKKCSEHVVLLHGLAMNSMIMYPLEIYLEDRGYTVHNMGYQSTGKTIEVIVNSNVGPAIEKIYSKTGKPVHIVTHSMGGIVARYYLATGGRARVQSMVMIAPPNRGSVMAGILETYQPARWFFGPALEQIRSGNGSITAKLPPLDVPTGIIAGCFSVNPMNSFLIPGEDDGTVAVAHTPAPGMQDFAVVPESHSGILFDPEVHRLVVNFIKKGVF